MAKIVKGMYLFMSNYLHLITYITRNIPDEESTNNPKLYNIKDDPGEETDVSDRYPEEYQTLKVLLGKECREVEHSRLKQ